MAYINQTHDPRRRATAIAGVALVHTAIALALLSLGVVRTSEIPPPWDPYVITPDPIPTPPPPSKPSPKAEDTSITVPDTQFEWERDATQVPVDDDIVSGGDTIVDDPPSPPLPPPRPSPTFTPKRPVPANLPERWITTDDYPARALRDEVEGVAGYRLVVSNQGRVSGCEVTRSTGSRELDQTTCRLISRRARFEAATDETGASVVGTYSGLVRWEIPD